MIQVLFFASLRERLNQEQIELDADGLSTVSDVYEQLLCHSDLFNTTLSDPKPLMAVNQEIALPSTPINDGDEVAFYPPVTGG